MSTAIDSYDDTILSNLQGAFTPQAAQDILQLAFSTEQKERMQELASKAREGDLTDVERSEADSFERVSSLLGILQSMARTSLQRSAS